MTHCLLSCLDKSFALSVKGCSERDYVIPTLIKGHHTLPQGEEEALLDSPCEQGKGHQGG
jgi:hypothetical protein